MQDDERWARERLHLLLDAILSAQQEIAFPHGETQRHDFWASLAKDADAGRFYLLERKPGPPLNNARRAAAVLHGPASEPVRPASTEALSVAIQQLLRALAPSFNAYAVAHAQAIAQSEPVVGARAEDYIAPVAEGARILLGRLLHVWGRLFLGEDLSNELERSLRLLSHGEVRPMLEKGRRKKGGQDALRSKLIGIEFANYLIARVPGETAYLAYELVAKLFGMGERVRKRENRGDGVRAWQERELTKSLVKECVASARTAGAAHDRALDEEMWRSVCDAAVRYRRFNGKGRLTSADLQRLRKEAGL
jgi:hypothetical protein